jgi:hypothetical protein
MSTNWHGKAYQQATNRHGQGISGKQVPMLRRRQGLTNEEWAVRAAAWSKAHGIAACLWLGPVLDPKPEPPATGDAVAP